jgi:hypothetical protein
MKNAEISRHPTTHMSNIEVRPFTFNFLFRTCNKTKKLCLKWVWMSPRIVEWASGQQVKLKIVTKPREGRHHDNDNAKSLSFSLRLKLS